jgi:hypothetical protein
VSYCALGDRPHRANCTIYRNGVFDDLCWEHLQWLRENTTKPFNVARLLRSTSRREAARELDERGNDVLSRPGPKRRESGELSRYATL